MDILIDFELVMGCAYISRDFGFNFSIPEMAHPVLIWTDNGLDWKSAD